MTPEVIIRAAELMRESLAASEALDAILSEHGIGDGLERWKTTTGEREATRE